MATHSIEQLHAALTQDLKKLGSPVVSNDVGRKTFSATVNGAVLQFAHKQADPAYWIGVKHYPSGPTSRLRLPRTAVEPDATVAAAKPKKARRKAVTA
jgi:hypothetical protein